jgi:hypothetical protein
LSNPRLATAHEESIVDTDAEMKRLEEAKDTHEPWLRKQPGFRGVGIGVNLANKLCLKILTGRMPPEVREQVEKRLADVDVEFEETGDFTAL